MKICTPVSKLAQSFGVVGTDKYAMTPPCVEPTLTDIQDTYSAALENTFHLTKRIDFVAGASYDWRVLDQAQGWAVDPTNLTPGGTPVYPTEGNGRYEYPTDTLKAFNWQSALIYRYSNDAKVYASVSDRTRFPTIFDLYSLRFNSQLPNPNLVPEQATNYEIGWAGKLWNANLSTAVFYSDVSNFIESVYTICTIPALCSSGTVVTQSQNVGNGHLFGWRGSADIPVTASLLTGGNLTLINRDIVNPDDPNFRLTGVPDAKGIFYAKWVPISGLTITPNVEAASTRWTSYVASSRCPCPSIRRLLSTWRLHACQHQRRLRVQAGGDPEFCRAQPVRPELLAHRRLPGARAHRHRRHEDEVLIPTAGSIDRSGVVPAKAGTHLCRLVHCFYMDSCFRGNDVKAVKSFVRWYKIPPAAAIAFAMPPHPKPAKHIGGIIMRNTAQETSKRILLAVALLGAMAIPAAAQEECTGFGWPMAWMTSADSEAIEFGAKMPGLAAKAIGLKLKPSKEVTLPVKSGMKKQAIAASSYSGWFEIASLPKGGLYQVYALA